MRDRHVTAIPALELFWEQADLDSAGEHPLERELVDRLDALVRYDQLIEDAEAAGNDDALENLTALRDREFALVDALSHAIRSGRASADRKRGG